LAKRPVFEVTLDEKIFVRREVIFQWYGGFAVSQSRKNIDGLHKNYLTRYPDRKVLEISSKGVDELGVKLSAFNLMIHRGDRIFSVEAAFQSSKVFERGGPFVDLLDMPSIKAKKDPRLKSSGNIIGFNFEGKDFPRIPTTYFYNRLYIGALVENKNLADELLAREFEAFTDIAFNPDKGRNCQAEAVAIFVSLSRQNLLEEALSDEKNFLRIIYKR
jgi:type I restriction enzyme M protein